MKIIVAVAFSILAATALAQSSPIGPGGPTPTGTLGIAPTSTVPIGVPPTGTGKLGTEPTAKGTMGTAPYSTGKLGIPASPNTAAIAAGARAASASAHRQQVDRRINEVVGSMRGAERYFGAVCSVTYDGRTVCVYR